MSLLPFRSSFNGTTFPALSLSVEQFNETTATDISLCLLKRAKFWLPVEKPCNICIGRPGKTLGDPSITRLVICYHCPRTSLITRSRYTAYVDAASSGEPAPGAPVPSLITDDRGWDIFKSNYA